VEKNTSKKKGHIKIDNADRNKKVLESYSTNINDCGIEKVMKGNKTRINAFKSSHKNINSKILPIELVSRKMGVASTSAVTPSPHPQSVDINKNPRATLQKEIIGKCKEKQDIDSKIPVVCNVMFNSPLRSFKDDVLATMSDEEKKNDVDKSTSGCVTISPDKNETFSKIQMNIPESMKVSLKKIVNNIDNAGNKARKVIIQQGAMNAENVLMNQTSQETDKI